MKESRLCSLVACEAVTDDKDLNAGLSYYRYRCKSSAAVAWHKERSNYPLIVERSTLPRASDLNVIQYMPHFMANLLVCINVRLRGGL